MGSAVLGYYTVNSSSTSPSPFEEAPVAMKMERRRSEEKSKK
jgi:hypothetical protein